VGGSNRLGSVLSVGVALHSPNRDIPRAEEADDIARQIGAKWTGAQVKAADGHAAFLLRAGFAVLAPDLRAHGASGGEIITYGIKEASDVHAWANRLFENQPVQHLYGLGPSLGGAVLLQSLPQEARFRAVVADCPFATFEEAAYDRMSRISRLPAAVFWPVVQTGFLYARLRYGIDLRQASPAATIRATAVPILLIHGTADSHISVRQSQELHALNPNVTHYGRSKVLSMLQASGKNRKRTPSEL